MLEKESQQPNTKPTAAQKLLALGSMKLSDKAIKISKIVFFAGAAAMVIINFVMLGLVGKNITYMTRMISPSDYTQLHSQGRGYYYAQISLIILGVILNTAICIWIASTYSFSRRKFIPTLLIVSAVWFGSIFVSIVFLSSSTQYQKNLSQINSPHLFQLYFLTNLSKLYTQVEYSPQNCDSSLCEAAKCASVRAYHAARGMVISYLILEGLLGLVIIPLSYIINSNRLEQLLELEK